MKLSRIVVALIVIAGCTSKLLNSSKNYTNEQIPLRMQLPGGDAAGSGKKTLTNFTRKQFAKYATQVSGSPDKQMLFYNGGNDNPDKIPYSAIGSLLNKVDTTKVKAIGFANRNANNQPYLHKTTIDKAGRIVTSEYLVKLPENYFYLFASAPITKGILQNEEAMIVVQDSLNRKYSAAIGSMQFSK